MSRLLSRGRLIPEIGSSHRLLLVTFIIFVAIISSPLLALAERKISAVCDVPKVIYGIAFSPDSKSLAIGTKLGITQIWNVQTGKKQSELRYENSDEIIERIAYSPDGKYLATSDDASASVWNVLTGKRLYKFPAQVYTGGGLGLRLFFTPNSEQLLVGDSFGAILWDLQSGKKIRIFHNTFAETGYEGELSRDGKYVLTNSEDGVRIWNVQSGKIVTKFLDSPPTGFIYGSLTPDGKKAFINHSNKMGIVWDVQAKRQLQTIPLTGARLWWYLSPNGEYILIFYDDLGGIAEIWDIQTGDKILTLPQKDINGFSAAFLTDSDRLLLITSKLTPRPHTYEVWSMKHRKVVARIPINHIHTVEFSPDGNTMAIVDDNLLQLWDTTNFTKLRDFC